jgi:hypothetical protein
MGIFWNFPLKEYLKINNILEEDNNHIENPWKFDKSNTKEGNSFISEFSPADWQIISLSLNGELIERERSPSFNIKKKSILKTKIHFSVCFFFLFFLIEIDLFILKWGRGDG